MLNINKFARRRKQITNKQNISSCIAETGIKSVFFPFLKCNGNNNKKMTKRTQQFFLRKGFLKNVASKSLNIILCIWH
jgi:hypothetical protein